MSENEFPNTKNIVLRPGSVSYTGKEIIIRMPQFVKVNIENILLYAVESLFLIICTQV
jgi:hypothetical protein